MFIIPMAGLSSRFLNNGYKKPKYQLPINKETVFSWSVRTFEKYFKTDKFIFIFRDVYNTKEFILNEINKLGILDYETICLSNETLGQADTVFQGIKDLNIEDEIYIFNIDSRIDNFIKPDWSIKCDGYLDVFIGDGNHWSFIEVGPNNTVIKTTEKERISQYCSNGLYFFKNMNIFKNAFLEEKKKIPSKLKEYYIAPLYNHLIDDKKHILYNIQKNKITFCGIPEEYELLKKALGE